MTDKTKAMETAYKMENRAVLSRNNQHLETIPFFWKFEEFCKNNGIKCDFSLVSNKYILSYDYDIEIKTKRTD